MTGASGGLRQTALPDDKEGYTLAADSSGVKISARSLQGVRYAAYTLRQLVIAKRGTMTTTGYIVPTMKIVDKPLLGKDLGITLIPQINVYGHASSARSCTLKHAILDLQPQYEPLFEPGGWNWCLTNPETQRVLRELIEEMLGDFDHPPYFHLGCDEAQPPSCPDCRKLPYSKKRVSRSADARG